MWYFAWILGLGFALALGILNAMWFEVRACQREERARKEDAGASSDWE